MKNTLKTKSVIYEPSGPAQEYCGRALNLFSGCTNACVYCYVPMVRHVTREKFHSEVTPRVNPEDIEASAAAVTADPKKPILFCFTCDPYPGINMLHLNLTRSAIYILHKAGHSVTILTKAGKFASRDLDLFQPGDSFGITLTSLDENQSRLWEPGAAPPVERIALLQEAKLAGINTWISLEPVIDPGQALDIIEATAGFTDHYKTGPLNYYGGDLPIPKYDRKKYVTDFIDLTAVKYKRGIYVKKSFASAICGLEGCRIGKQLP